MKEGHTWSIRPYRQREHLYLEMTGWFGKKVQCVLGKLGESRLSPYNYPKVPSLLLIIM